MVERTQKTDTTLARSTRFDDPLTLLHQRMNRLFEDFTANFPAATSSAFAGTFPATQDFTTTTRWPNVDVSYDDDRVHIAADLPGFEAKDVQITMEASTLLISGEKRTDSEQTGRHWARRERSTGNFERAIPLPTDIIAEKTDARLTSGVLTIVVPRKTDERTRARTIPIKSN